MNKKDKLIESTLLALQGKLELNEKVNIKEAEAKVQEDVEVETNDAEVTVGEDTTIIETDEATVTVEQNKEESSEGEECTDTETAEEVVEVPVEGEETIVPEVDVDTETAEEVVEESKEIKTEDSDPRPNETKMYDLIEGGLVDTAQLAKELLGFLEDDDIKRFMEIYEYENLTESKKYNKEECEDKVTKFSSKSFNDAFTKMYKEKYKTVESFKTTKVTLGKDTLKVEGKVLNKDGLGKEVKFEMKQVSNKNGVVRFQQQNYTGLLKESKNSTLRLLATTNNKVLECRYILSK